MKLFYQAAVALMTLAPHIGALPASEFVKPSPFKPIIVLDKRGTPCIQHIERRSVGSRGVKPDFSRFPANVQKLPIKTSVNIDGEHINIWALEEDHVIKVYPILKEYLCGHPQYAPMFPILCGLRRHATLHPPLATVTSGQWNHTGGHTPFPSTRGRTSSLHGHMTSSKWVGDSESAWSTRRKTSPPKASDTIQHSSDRHKSANASSQSIYTTTIMMWHGNHSLTSSSVVTTNRGPQTKHTVWAQGSTITSSGSASIRSHQSYGKYSSQDQYESIVPVPQPLASDSGKATMTSSSSTKGHGFTRHTRTRRPTSSPHPSLTVPTRSHATTEAEASQGSTGGETNTHPKSTTTMPGIARSKHRTGAPITKSLSASRSVQDGPPTRSQTTTTSNTKPSTKGNGRWSTFRSAVKESSRALYTSIAIYTGVSPSHPSPTRTEVTASLSFSTNSTSWSTPPVSETSNILYETNVTSSSATQFPHMTGSSHSATDRHKTVNVTPESSATRTSVAPKSKFSGTQPD